MNLSNVIVNEVDLFSFLLGGTVQVSANESEFSTLT